MKITLNRRWRIGGWTTLGTAMSMMGEAGGGAGASAGQGAGTAAASANAGNLSALSGASGAAAFKPIEALGGGAATGLSSGGSGGFGDLMSSMAGSDYSNVMQGVTKAVREGGFLDLLKDKEFMSSLRNINQQGGGMMPAQQNNDQMDAGNWLRLLMSQQ